MIIYRLDLWDVDRGGQIASVPLPDLPHHMELSPDAGWRGSAGSAPVEGGALSSRQGLAGLQVPLATR